MSGKRKRVHPPTKRIEFLAALMTGAIVTEAAKSCGIGVQTVYDWRRDDPQFAADWEEAYLRGADALLLEAQRRAMRGTTEPVFHLGKKVGVTRKYSDTLLMMLLKSRDPVRYCDRARTAAIMRRWQEDENAKRLANGGTDVSVEVLAMLESWARQKAALVQ